ncbi:Fic family protein [Persephonella sp.]
MDERLIIERKKLLEDLGGLPEPVVENREWLYLLENETRNSILIEGYFIDEEELEAVLSGNRPVSKSQEEAVKYFKTARSAYSLAYENYRSGDFLFGIPLIRQINKELGFEGDFRKGKVKITGAEFTPPSDYIENWLRIFVRFVSGIYGTDFFNKLAVSHVFFEEFHPFKDGNGRTGRIILNYILISHGYPLTVIKGDEKSRHLYFKGLEEVDRQMKGVFEKYNSAPPDEKEVLNILKGVKSTILKGLILESLRESLDRLIIDRAIEKGEVLEPVGQLLKKMGYSPESGRQLIKRGRIIAVKIKNRWYSTENTVKALL